MRWQQAGGSILISWWLFDTVLKISKYGLYSWDVLWFCSLIVLFAGISLLFENATMLTGVLASSLPMQAVWIFEYAAIVLGGMQFAWEDFSPAYLFQGGIPWFEFANTFRHFLVIPLVLAGWLSLRKQAKLAPIAVSVSVLLFLSVSLIASSATENINCVYESCFKERVNPQGYSLLFIVAMVVLSGSIAAALNVLAEHLRKVPASKIETWKVRITGGLAVIFGILIVRGILLYSRIG